MNCSIKSASFHCFQLNPLAPLIEIIGVLTENYEAEHVLGLSVE